MERRRLFFIIGQLWIWINDWFHPPTFFHQICTSGYLHIDQLLSGTSWSNTHIVRYGNGKKNLVLVDFSRWFALPTVKDTDERKYFFWIIQVKNFNLSSSRIPICPSDSYQIIASWLHFHPKLIEDPLPPPQSDSNLILCLNLPLHPALPLLNGPAISSSDGNLASIIRTSHSITRLWTRLQSHRQFSWSRLVWSRSSRAYCAGSFPFCFNHNHQHSWRGCLDLCNIWPSGRYGVFKSLVSIVCTPLSSSRFHCEDSSHLKLKVVVRPANVLLCSLTLGTEMLDAARKSGPHSLIGDIYLRVRQEGWVGLIRHLFKDSSVESFVRLVIGLFLSTGGTRLCCAILSAKMCGEPEITELRCPWAIAGVCPSPWWRSNESENRVIARQAGRANSAVLYRLMRCRN